MYVEEGTAEDNRLVRGPLFPEMQKKGLELCILHVKLASHVARAKAYQ